MCGLGTFVLFPSNIKFCCSYNVPCVFQSGKSALQLAARGNYVAVVDMLIKAERYYANTRVSRPRLPVPVEVKAERYYANTRVSRPRLPVPVEVPLRSRHQSVGGSVRLTGHIRCKAHSVFDPWTCHREAASTVFCDREGCLFRKERDNDHNFWNKPFKSIL